MREGEAKWIKGFLEAFEANSRRDGAGGGEDGEGIGGRSQANVPDDEFTGGGAEAFGQPHLAEVKSLGFRHGANDRMKGFAAVEGLDRVRAGGEANEAVAGRRRWGHSEGRCGVGWERSNVGTERQTERGGDEV